MIPFQLIYEITSCRVKYEEGFVSVFGHIFGKPETMWTKADRDLIVPTDYSLCIGFSLQTGTLLLLQCFWNYLANSVRANFMSSKEFKLYIIWTFMTIIIFPVLQFNFSRSVYDYTYKEVIPELVYGCGLFIIAILGIRSHYRFNNLLQTTKNSINSRFVSNKIMYFQELNFILTIALFFFSTSLIILCADGLTGKKTLNVHKFSSDFLICNTNVSSIVVWTVVILIFHPKKRHESQNLGYQQQQLITPVNNLSSSQRFSQHQQHESMATTTTTTTTTSYAATQSNHHHHQSGKPPMETYPLSTVHSNATTLVPNTTHASQHQHSHQGHGQHRYDQQGHYSYHYHQQHHHHDSDPCKISNQSLSYSANESNISSSSQDHLYPGEQQQQQQQQTTTATTLPPVPPVARNSSNGGCAFERNSSVFTTRQPLAQNNHGGNRNPSQDSVWLHQSPKGRWN
ncbi:unnamed protein product [Absidia cylindrospora]